MSRDTASETVRTLLVYGYNLDPPTGEQTEGNSCNLYHNLMKLKIVYNC